MAQNNFGRNITFPIYNADGTVFHGLELNKATVDSVVMSLGDKVTGDVYYIDNSLAVTMQEYIVVNSVKYTLVSPPTIVREGMVADNTQLKGMTKYSFTFYHPMYMLGNFPFTDIAVTQDEEKYLSQNKTFSWIGNLFEFVQKLNANLKNTQWAIDVEIPQYEQDGSTITPQWGKALKQSDVLSFDKNFISDALKTAYDTWEIPFVISHYESVPPSGYTRLKWVRISEIHQSVTNTTAPFWLFIYNLNSVSAANKKITYCKVFNEDTLLFDLIPCKDSNNNVGLYDVVEGVFYGSNQEVAFEAGGEIGKNKKFSITFGSPTNKIYDQDGNEYVFRFGKGLGLKNNSRTPRNNKIVTRIVGYGSDRNVPYGYPQIPWTGNQTWDYTINNNPNAANSYPIYDGIVGGQRVRLIKHPFTRTTLMPSIYSETVNKKVNPNATGYDPDIEIKDYYDAIDDATHAYPNNINVLAPSVEVHQFDKEYPQLGEASIISATPYDEDGEYYTYTQWYNYLQTRIATMRGQGIDGWQMQLIVSMRDNTCQYTPETAESLPSASIPEGHWEWRTGQATATLDSVIKGHFVYVTLVSSWYNETHKILQIHADPTPEWDDTMNDDGEYIQSYFKIKLPQLTFDIYACAAITQEMNINMRSGSCMGCTFPVQVDWELYKANFYDSNGNFAPDGAQRDLEKFPKSNLGSIDVIVKKDNNTFGTLMPNQYRYPVNGDKFVILGISLPTSYITTAEQSLDETMKEYMLENNVHYYDYPLKFDEHFLATHQNILEQIKNNNIVKFQYAGTQMSLYIKQITIKYGDKPLPQYDITLTDDVEIVLNQIGQVTDDVSRMRVQVSELQKYYSENLIQEINNKLSKIVDDVCQGRITFQQGLDSLGSVIFHDKIQSPQFEEGLYKGRGWRIDNLGNAEFESARVRSFLEVVELMVNRLQAQEGDTLFTDNDQIEKVDKVVAGDGSISYILSLKEKWDGYITPQMTGNILRGIINTLAAKGAGVSDESSRSVEIDGENKYYTSWMRVIETHNTTGTTLQTNQIRVELYSDDYEYIDEDTGEVVTMRFTPAGRNFEPCELMTVARWGCYLSPDDTGISSAEKESRERRQRLFMISVTDGRVVKYTKVNKPILEEWNYGVSIGELPQFVKEYPDVRSVLNQVGEHTDWLYAQGVVVGKFIKVDINGKPEVTIVDCGEWIDGSTIPDDERVIRHGVYVNEGWNGISQQFETHDVWHNNARWRCLINQPIVRDGVEVFKEPTDENVTYWKKVQSAAEGKDGTSAVSVFKWNTSPTAHPSISGTAYPPSGWSKSAPNRPMGDFYLWMSTANLIHENTVDAWSTPVRISGDKGEAGADADNREWIYIADTEYRNPYADSNHSHPNDITYGEVSPGGTASGSEINKNQKDWVPNGWSDRAIAIDPITNLFVYASWRDKGSDGNWGNFQNPILWSNWGVQGLDGDGVQYIFKLFDHELSSSERVAQAPDNAVMNSNGEWMPQNENPATKNNDWYDDAPSTTPSMPFCYCSTIKQIRGEWEKLPDNIHGKFNTLALWSKWSEDGESAPFYTEEWFAWSDDETTSSVNTPPTIVGNWSSTIPQKNARYLWRKSVKYVLNNNNTYVPQAAEYFRMSGTDGASIKTKGTAVVVITSSGSFPTSTSTGYKTGDIGLKQGDSTPYKATVSGSTVSWSKNGMSVSNDGDSYTITKDCVIDLDGDGTSANIKGHLVTWSEEVGKWVDLGEFKGEDGETYYSHIVWATNVVYNETTGEVESVVGYAPTKAPNDTAHVWMGTHVDQTQEDPTSYDQILLEYTWTYTKGADGTSPYFADLNNEMDAIQCKHDGSVIADQIVSTVISMWKGSAVETFVIDNIYRNGTQLMWDGNNNGVWPRVSGSTVSLEFTTSASIADIDDFKITIHSYNDNTVTRELHFTINGVRANAIYRLVPSCSQIVKKKDGTYVPSVNITCSVEKTENGSTSTPSSSEYTLEKSVNGGSYTTYSATAPSSITSDLKFRLKVGGKVVDLETIPLVSDGNKGDTGDSAPAAFASPAQISIPCYSNGNVKAQKITSVIFSLKVGTHTATVTSCADGTKPTGVTVQGQANNAVTITVGTSATASGLSAGVTFTVTGIYDGKTYSATVTVALIGSIQGEEGDRGKIGRFFYYAGAWNDFASTDSFLVNDAQAPYFYYNNNYWVFNPETNGTYTKQNMGTPSSSSSNWKLMTSDFKYIITEAIFGSYAHFGGAIINGDYLMSQYGYMLGFCNTKTPVNDNTQYQNVDMDDVLGDDDMYDPNKLIWNNSNLKEITSTTYTSIATTSFVQNRYYTLEIDESTGIIGNEMSWIVVSRSGTVIASGTITSTTATRNRNCVNFKSTVSETCYLRVKVSNQNDPVDINGFYLRFAKFIPYLAMDLLAGKFVANNIIARGELHADSLYHTMVYGNSNDDRFTINDESIVNLGTRAVGTTVILPSPTICKGRVIELFNHATSYSVTWVGALSTSAFSSSYGSGLGIRVLYPISYQYVKFYCDGTNWWILKAEA